MDRAKFLKYRSVLLHVLLWVVVWIFYRYFLSYNSDDKAYATWFSSFLLPLTVVVTYIMIYRLIPKYLLVKDYKRFALKSFYLFVATCYIIALIIYGCLIFLLDFNINLIPPMSKNFLFILILVLLVVGALSSITILNQNLKTISRNKELQNKILATQLELKEQELHYLKSQIHPHFLFNTLNTIYGLALSQSEQTPDIILKLSNLLDYILYQVSKPRVMLREEVLHIEEYMELEKIRFKDTLKIKFNTDEIDDTIEIAPMILIPFVENAFKHGSIIDGYLGVEVKVSLQGNQLNFIISNTYIQSNDELRVNGIGLANIRKRLDLHYPEIYKLIKETNNNRYSIDLTIFDLTRIIDA